MKIIKPLGDRVLVKELKETDAKRPSGIIIPETVSSTNVKIGEITAVGTGLYTHNGILIPMTVKVGDHVVLPPVNQMHGQEVKIGSESYLLFRESDLLGILESTN
jgi:chaperonin GroES